MRGGGGGRRKASAATTAQSVFYLDDGVQQGHSCPTVPTAVAVVCLSQQPLDLIGLVQLILGFSLLFVAGIGLELKRHKAGSQH